MKQFEILLENRADKLALRFLKERGVTDYNEQMRIIGSVKHDIPNLRLDNSKFVLGALRLYYDNQLSDAQSIGALDKALKYIHMGGHKDEYDENLNGKSLEELSEMFRDIARQYSDSDRQRSANQQFSGGSNYTIIPIDSYQEAKKYSRYTSWCVTQDKTSFDNYTAQGQKFYFCLMNGFKSVRENDDGAPLNEYGLSMISVLVDCSGDLERVTTRYNHDYNGENNPGLETPEQLEKVLNVPFYQTFKPYTEEELEAKGLSPKEEIGEAELSGLNEITRTIIERYPRLKKCVIPNSVTSIGDSAFARCSGLTSVTIPNSVKSIGNYAFYGCDGLTSVTISNSVTSIGDWAFAGCSGITHPIIINDIFVFLPKSYEGHYSIPENISKIIGGAFEDCSALTSVTIPISVKSIGALAFYRCSSLTSVTIPNSVTSIEHHAFSQCRSLTSVTISNSVASIGNLAFAGCSGLTSVTIPNSVKSIGEFAFEDIDVVYYSGSATGAPWGANRVLPYNGIKNECITITTNSLRKAINEIVNKLI